MRTLIIVGCIVIQGIIAAFMVLLIMSIAFTLTGCAPSVRQIALRTPSHQAMYVPPTTATMAQPFAELKARVEGMGVTIAEIEEAGQFWGLADQRAKVIALSPDLGTDAKFEVLAHEAAHLFQPMGLSESEREVFAERVMVEVCDFYGHDARGISGQYLGRYKSGFGAQKALAVDYRRAVRVLTGRERP